MVEDGLCVDNVMTFPCFISVKAMGKNEPDFESYVVKIIDSICNDFDNYTVHSNLSKNAKYLSVTVRIMAKSREQADDVYQALTDDSRVILSI